MTDDATPSRLLVAVEGVEIRVPHVRKGAAESPGINRSAPYRRMDHPVE